MFVYGNIRKFIWIREKDLRAIVAVLTQIDLAGRGKRCGDQQLRRQRGILEEDKEFN